MLLYFFYKLSLNINYSEAIYSSLTNVFMFELRSVNVECWQVVVCAHLMCERYAMNKCSFTFVSIINSRYIPPGIYDLLLLSSFILHMAQSATQKSPIEVPLFWANGVNPGQEWSQWFSTFKVAVMAKEDLGQHRPIFFTQPCHH